MANPDPPLTPDRAARLYDRQIRPMILDGIDSAADPVAIFVGADPGAGMTAALQRLRREARFAEAMPAVISRERLQPFHPAWRQPGGPGSARPTGIIDGWGERLVEDAIEKRASVLIGTGMDKPAWLLALAGDFRTAEYRVELVVVAADVEASRLGVVTGFERLLSQGVAAHWLNQDAHSQGMQAVRDTLSQVQAAKAADQIRLITRDGRELFDNALERGAWRHEGSAVEALDAYRERELPAREKADNALRWHTLVARLQARARELPREVIAQAMAWRSESTERGLADPEARKLYEAGLAAETFRCLATQHFVREFPQYRSAATKLEKARDYADGQFQVGAERERFVAIARERIAAQIEDGRQYARARGAGEAAVR
jgi:UDP-N-acetylglucosamine kinase